MIYLSPTHCFQVSQRMFPESPEALNKICLLALEIVSHTPCMFSSIQAMQGFHYCGTAPPHTHTMMLCICTSACTFPKFVIFSEWYYKNLISGFRDRELGFTCALKDSMHLLKYLQKCPMHDLLYLCSS